MAQFSDDLFRMRGKVLGFRPNIDSTKVDAFINDRIRMALDTRTYWSDLLKRGVLSCPAKYNTGTIATANGSAVVTGTDTAWPTNDVVATTVPTAIDEIGYVEVIPASMAGITADSFLYISDGSNSEILTVVEATSTTFIAKFENTYSGTINLTSSSLAGRQLRISAAHPIFTVKAVTDATHLTLDNLWGSTAVTGLAYEIYRCFYTLAIDLKDILRMVDKQYGGKPVRIHAPLMELDWRDPQRTSYGPPEVLYDHSPNESGNMQYELWPHQKGAYQLEYLYYRQWPELVKDTDRPPWFINPSVFVDGAIADALRWKRDPKDPFHNPMLAREFEAKYRYGIEMAKNADESKLLRDLQYRYQDIIGAQGANFWQSHDMDIQLWDH